MADTPETDQITSRDVAKGAGTTLIARLGGVIDVVAQPLYVALFGLTGYGLYAVLWATVNLIENIADLGMTSALQRTVPQARSEADAVASLRAAMLMGVGPCIAIAAIVSATPDTFAHIFNAAAADEARLARAIGWFVWTLPLWAFVEVATSALRARRVFGPEIRLRLFWEQVARMMLAVAFWSLSWGTMALIYAHLISLSIVCLLCIRLLARHYDLTLLRATPVRGDMWSQTLKAGLAVLPSNIVARLFGDAPALALNTLLPGAAGAQAGGLFAIVRKISSLVQLVRTAFAYVLSPLASAASTGGVASVRGIYGFATRVSFALAVPLGAVLIAAGPSILRLFGKEASVALAALAIFLAARTAEAVFGAAMPIQQVISGFRSQLVGSIVGLGIAVALGLWLMPEAGLTGMTLAVGIGTVIAAAIPLWQLHILDDIHPFAAPFAKVAVRAFGVGAIGYGLTLITLLLPHWLQIPAQLPLLAGALWASLRLALPIEDRVSLGKTGRALKLA